MVTKNNKINQRKNTIKKTFMKKLDENLGKRDYNRRFYKVEG